MLCIQELKEKIFKTCYILWTVKKRDFYCTQKKS